MAILSDLGTEILVPACAIVGIVFSVVQWILVSRVKLSPERHSLSNSSKNGTAEYLIEEEEGLNDHSVVQKCAEIQNAISEGEFSIADLSVFRDFFFPLFDLVAFLVAPDCMYSFLWNYGFC